MSHAASDTDCEQEFINQSLARISTHAGVYGLLVVHPAQGRVLHKAGFNNSTEECDRWAHSVLSFLAVAASTVRTLDHTDDLTFLRMQWRRKHIIVCPDPHRDYTIIVVQDAVHQAAPEPADMLALDARLEALDNTATMMGGGTTMRPEQ